MWNYQFFIINALISLLILFLLLGLLLPTFGTHLHLYYKTGATTTYLRYPLTLPLHFTIHLAFRYPLTFTTGAFTTYSACVIIQWVYLSSLHTTILLKPFSFLGTHLCYYIAVVVSTYSIFFFSISSSFNTFFVFSFHLTSSWFSLFRCSNHRFHVLSLHFTLLFFILTRDYTLRKRYFTLFKSVLYR